eukprot:3311950-Pyramimonas_sp.AAC.3
MTSSLLALFAPWGSSEMRAWSEREPPQFPGVVCMDVADWTGAHVDLGLTILVDSGGAVHVDGRRARAGQDVPQEDSCLYLSVSRVLQLEVDIPSPVSVERLPVLSRCGNFGKGLLLPVRGERRLRSLGPYLAAPGGGVHAGGEYPLLQQGLQSVRGSRGRRPQFGPETWSSTPRSRVRTSGSLV